MHGRLKVRTSEEEAARKRKEQQQKVLAYRAGMQKILHKKSTAELDGDLIQLTAAILSRNPDISTLWNLRRQAIVALQTDAAFDKDLEFTETCLLANPKSYCVWHHRCWLLETMSAPNWQREVDVCTKYLKLDERNFHVWDYRRYVVAKAEIPMEKELEFCTEKIQNNFSNYSSWHLRSKLLPILYPHETDSVRPINETVLKEELELVLTAAFTDPKDSSAWFYQRWLLGYSQPQLDIAAFKITKTHAIVSFSIPVNLNDERCALALDGTTKFETKHWRPVASTSAYSTIWMLEDSFELNTTNVNRHFRLEFSDEHNCLHGMQVRQTDDGGLFGIKMPKFGYEFGAAIVEVLQDQLKSCQELLEYEPDSKWTLLTAALLMRAIDRTQHHDTTLNYLALLGRADPLRSGYYTDLANKWSVEQVLEQWITTNTERQSDTVDLSQLQLVTLSYEQYLCVANAIDLRGCNLRSDNAAKLSALEKCHVRVKL